MATTSLAWIIPTNNVRTTTRRISNSPLYSPSTTALYQQQQEESATTTSTTYTPDECAAIQAALPSPLIDAHGNVLDNAQTIASLVQGQRVALYFAAGWSRDCRELDFMLAQYRSALKDSQQPIQLIYVPSDKSQEEQLARMQELGLEVGVPLGETADALKKKYGVWPDAEVDKFGGVVRERVDDGEFVVGDEEVEAVQGVEQGGEETDQASSDIVAAFEAGVTPAEVFPKPTIEDDSGRRSGIPAFVVLDNKGEEFCFLNTERDSITALADWPLDDLQGHW
ncbi:thioredoxin-like protein [Nitzschia inconspicua]|uniref:Thioredoxin-like protein n=1 Tax=Nitzschia inconspicua TaxID=303405 RepID=A0A9K3KP04_9STRA|nr:thioredoxin-like protein [Nitzschia inconspicua]